MQRRREPERPHRATGEAPLTTRGTRESPKILLVEDEGGLAAMLVKILDAENFAVDVAGDGHRGLHLGLTRRYDLMILDRRLPGIDGLDLLSRLRANGNVTPTLVLSALASPADRVRGLDAGAEDYLGKPFDVDELLARLRALRRRHLDTARRLPVPGGALDLDTCLTIGEDGSEIRLSRRECALLATLAARPRKVFSRDELRTLAFQDAGTEVVDTYVHYLRRKLGHGIVDTVRGLGYQLGVTS